MSNDPNQNLIQALLAQQPSPPPAPLPTKTFVDSGVSREPVTPSSSYASTRGGSGEVGAPVVAAPNLAFLPVVNEEDEVVVLPGLLTYGSTTISVSGATGSTDISPSDGDYIYIEIEFSSGVPSSASVTSGSSFPEKTSFETVGDYEQQTAATRVIGVYSGGAITLASPGNISMIMGVSDSRIAFLPVLS